MSTEEIRTDAVETPRIECSCGFTVVGNDEFENNAAFSNHCCPNAPDDEPGPWYSYLFSFWSFAIVAVIVWGIVLVMTR